VKGVRGHTLAERQAELRARMAAKPKSGRDSRAHWEWRDGNIFCGIHQVALRVTPSATKYCPSCSREAYLRYYHRVKRRLSKPVLRHSKTAAELREDRAFRRIGMYLARQQKLLQSIEKKSYDPL
jgi:hypothetical protein